MSAMNKIQRFLTAALIVTVATSATTTTTTSLPQSSSIQAILGNRPSTCLTKKGCFSAPYTVKKHDEAVQGIRTNVGLKMKWAPGKFGGSKYKNGIGGLMIKRPQGGIGRSKINHSIGTKMGPMRWPRDGFGISKVKFCLTRGRCYKKMLVCPKSCATLGQCRLNCSKCTVRC